MLQAFRVAGIPIRVDASWLLIFGLIAWSLAAGYFPRVVPDSSTGVAWLHGVLAAALLFVSVLLHELSHAVVALEHGVPVAGIRLHIFGGVSELEAEPPTPRAEMLIAIVGPLTSFVIAATCYGVGRLVAGWPWLAALTGYLAGVNLIIGLFNLVPGFPLDGGRLLRAMLWAWSGRVGWATRWASRAGSAFAFALVGLGVVRALGGELVGGLWFMLIGLFLHQAARSSEQLERIRARLTPLRAADVMTPASAPAQPSAPLSDRVDAQASAWEAFLKLGRSRAGQVPVVSRDRLVGLIGRRDIQAALDAGRADADVAGRAA
jgi:Zn-dependent protease